MLCSWLRVQSSKSVAINICVTCLIYTIWWEANASQKKIEEACFENENVYPKFVQYYRRILLDEITTKNKALRDMKKQTS